MADHRAEAERYAEDLASDYPEDDAGHRGALHALLAIDDTLTEILDRLPGRPTLYTLEGVAAEFGVDLDEPAPADVDPDESLAMDLYHDSLLIPPVKEIGPTAWLSERDHEMWLGVARAAREHIEANQLYAYRPVAAERDKAEADLARVTKERDTAERLANRNADTARDFEDRYETSHANFLAASSDLDRVTKERDRLTHLLGSHADGHRCTCEMTDPGKPGIEPPTWEQDPWCLTHPDMDVIVAEVRTLKAKADRYDALRADVERSAPGGAAAIVLSGILARDTERAES